MKYKITVIFILFLAFMLSGFGNNAIEPLKYKINDVFPKTVKDWEGRDVKIQESVYTMLDKEELMIRNYKNRKSGRKLDLAIVYTNKRDHIHDPNVCYRGQGISMDRESKIKISDNDIGVLVDGHKNRKPYKILYWYTDLNRTFDKRFDFMKNIIISKMLNKRVPAIVLVVITAQDISSSELASFANDTNVILKGFKD